MYLSVVLFYSFSILGKHSNTSNDWKDFISICSGSQRDYRRWNQVRKITIDLEKESFLSVCFDFAFLNIVNKTCVILPRSNPIQIQKKIPTELGLGLKGIRNLSLRILFTSITICLFVIFD